MESVDRQTIGTMTITLSQRDYWDLFRASQTPKKVDPQNPFELVTTYPTQLGQGSHRFMRLRQGVTLQIDRYQPYDDVELVSPERSHSLEYDFLLSGKVFQPHVVTGGQYSLCGSGTAPAEVCRKLADEMLLSVNVHIWPSTLKAFLGETFDFTQGGLAHLIRPCNQVYYQHRGTTTVAMQTALHQILNCPFDGVTKKVYLESKVWELMALLIDQEQLRQDSQPHSNPLKSDDIERIHHAREILAQRLEHPPSLLDLARQVGLNDCTLKRGFRQVFGETAFGYLYNQRMETARQLLLAGEVNVSEAARQVGFASRGYFAACFRKKYGVSPREYLRQQKNSG